MFVYVTGRKTKDKYFFDVNDIVYVKLVSKPLNVKVELLNYYIYTIDNINLIYDRVKSNKNLVLLHDINNFPIIVNKKYIKFIRVTNEGNILKFKNEDEPIMLIESYQKIINKLNN